MRAQERGGGVSASVASTAVEAREVTASAIDDAIRELQVAIRYLELRKRELDRPSPAFTAVFPPRGKP